MQPRHPRKPAASSHTRCDFESCSDRDLACLGADKCSACINSASLDLGLWTISLAACKRRKPKGRFAHRLMCGVARKESYWMQKKQAFLSHVPNTLKERFCAQHCIMQVAGRMMHPSVEKAQAEVAKRKSRGLYMAAPTHWTQALSLSAESGGPASDTSGTLARTMAYGYTHQEPQTCLHMLPGTTLARKQRRCNGREEFRPCWTWHG